MHESYYTFISLRFKLWPGLHPLKTVGAPTTETQSASYNNCQSNSVLDVALLSQNW